jgi:hypothetical protein
LNATRRIKGESDDQARNHDASAYSNRGVTYKSQGKLDKAEADFAKADRLEKSGQ